MKRLFRILVFVIMFSLTGCYIGSNFNFDAKDLSMDVKEIEFVYYDNKNPVRMMVTETSDPFFDDEQCEFLETLDPNLIDVFINDLSNIKFQALKRISNAPVGYTIILRDFSSYVIVLSCAVINLIEYSFVAKLEAYSGRLVENYGIFRTHKDFDKLAKKYFASFK